MSLLNDLEEMAQKLRDISDPTKEFVIAVHDPQIFGEAMGVPTRLGTISSIRINGYKFPVIASRWLPKDRVIMVSRDQVENILGTNLDTSTRCLESDTDNLRKP